MNFIRSLFTKKTPTNEPISAKDKELVQMTFDKVVPISDAAAEIFYTRLFELDPELKALFKTDITAQGKKLMAMLGAAVKGLDDLNALVPVVQDLGKRHVGYGVRDEHYDTVAAALLYTLEKGLGEAWNQEVKSAWVNVYVLLSTTMKEAATEVAA